MRQTSGRLSHHFLQVGAAQLGKPYSDGGVFLNHPSVEPSIQIVWDTGSGSRALRRADLFLAQMGRLAAALDFRTQGSACSSPGPIDDAKANAGAPGAYRIQSRTLSGMPCARRSHQIAKLQADHPQRAPFVIKAHETVCRINNFVEMLQIFLVWYSWVGSNHRPPVPQSEIRLHHP
jgi:hypothetical protein